MARVRPRREDTPAVRTSLTGSTVVATDAAGAEEVQISQQPLRRSRRIQGKQPREPREYQGGIPKRRTRKNSRRKPKTAINRPARQDRSKPKNAVDRPTPRHHRYNNLTRPPTSLKHSLIAYWIVSNDHSWPPGFIDSTVVMTTSRQGTASMTSLGRTATYNSAKEQGHDPPNQKGTPAKDSSRTGSSRKDHYRRSTFASILEKGNGGMTSYMHDYVLPRPRERGPNDQSKKWFEELQQKEQINPYDARFQDDEVFQLKLQRLPNRTEAMVLHTLHDLVCPSAEELAIANREDPELGPNYELLVDAMNEGWGDRFTLYQDLPKPQPDYCVGFQKIMLSDAQWEKIQHVSGDGRRFAPTSTMFFPFLACEAKSSKQSIEYAKNQNAHTLTLAVMAVVELFRGAGLENSIHREILGFSVSYDPKEAGVYGHFPVIIGERTKIYIHQIFDVSFKHSHDRWALYRFVKNVYELWAPKHFDRISLALDKLDPSWSISSATTHAVPSRVASTPTIDESIQDMEQLGLRSNADPAAVPQPRRPAAGGSGGQADAQSTTSTERERPRAKRRRGKNNG